MANKHVYYTNEYDFENLYEPCRDGLNTRRSFVLYSTWSTSAMYASFRAFRI